ncbi:hypothetical protein V1478_005670 [Vespula squamosa]|uniref:Uncharacterized protein n=1 Tax=Vespula squamosa TaxID=30214 RepID=A0ABD2B9F9_VESSQ
MHKGHIAYFTTVRGTSLDIGAKELADNDKLPAISEATLGRIKVTKKNERYYIVLPVKGRLSVSTQLEILDEALHSLLDAALELQLETIAISRSPVGDVPWANETERIQIIHENHTTPISGHIRTPFNQSGKKIRKKEGLSESRITHRNEEETAGNIDKARS